MDDYYGWWWLLLLKTVLILVPLPSLDCTRMSLLNLHALTVCLIGWLSFTHTTASTIPQISVVLFFSFTHAAIYLSMHPSVHPSTPSFSSSSFSLCLVSSVLWRNRSPVFSLCVFTPVSLKLNKELNQGHHLWLLCASMTPLSANACAFKGPYQCFFPKACFKFKIIFCLSSHLLLFVSSVISALLCCNVNMDWYANLANNVKFSFFNGKQEKWSTI